MLTIEIQVGPWLLPTVRCKVGSYEVTGDTTVRPKYVILNVKHFVTNEPLQMFWKIKPHDDAELDKVHFLLDILSFMPNFHHLRTYYCVLNNYLTCFRA